LSDYPDVASILKERQVFSDLFKDQLAKAQNKMKIFVDSKCSERSFQVREQVHLKLQPYAQSSVVNRPFLKLAFKYFGPYAVLEKVSSVAYKLKLLNGSVVHLVFDVSQLKTYTPDYCPVHPTLPDVPALDVLEVLLEKILDRRLVNKGNVVITQILVQWSGLPKSSLT
jgi:hypothetical protein